MGMSTNGTDGLLCAYHLDGTGGGTPLAWADLEAAEARGTPQAPVWVHLMQSAPHTARWLSGPAALPPLVAEALLARETRPQCREMEGGVLLNLRAVNLNPEARPEDMVSIRVWLEPARIITVRVRRLQAVNELQDALDRGVGPQSPGTFVTQLCRILGLKVQPVLDNYQDRLDDLEESAFDHGSRATRNALASLRRDVIALARYLRPQVEALTTLADEGPEWLGSDRRAPLLASRDRFLRHVEDLDALRDHTSVLHDQIAGRLAERMNATTLRLSAMAGLFLPLSFLTGLLGINVGGIPLADSPWGFASVCLVLGAIGLGQFWLFKRKDWL